MYGAFEDVKVLLFEGFAGALGNLTSKVESVAGGGVVQVGACVFTLEERGVEDVGGGVGERGDGGGFRGDFGEEVEELGHWVRALVEYE